MIYYGLMFSHSRVLLADILGAEDPFALAPATIVERVMTAGYTPDVTEPSSTPHRQFGTVTRVEREGQVFLVAVSRDAERISVQEEREDAYERQE